jgi:HEPN domain-containing protein
MMVTMSTVPEKWVEKALYDLDTARAMLASDRYFYVLFCCQQAVEKMLKAVIAKQTGRVPPRLHNLNRLAERTGLEFSEKRMDLLGELSSYYVQSRYPEETDTETTREIAEDTLTLTEEAVQWLQSVM